MKLKLKSKLVQATGLPATVGLFHRRQEIVAVWYSRKPFALEIEWQVWVEEAFDGGQWVIDHVIAFDKEGRISETFELTADVILCGPIKGPPLEPKHIEFRKLKGLPLQDNPYIGDKLVVHIV